MRPAQELLDVRVHWMEGYGNSPSWYGRVNYIQDFFEADEPIWEKKGSMFRAEKGIEVNYKHYTAPDRGYGGSLFSTMLIDGTKKNLIGPWSSRATCCNEAFPARERCIEMALVEDLERWERGYTFLSSNIRVGVLIDWLRKHDFMVEQVFGRDSKKYMQRGKIRLAWQTDGSDREVRLLPLRLDGSPKFDTYKIIEEIK